MTFRIQHYSINGQHVELCADGSIELYIEPMIVIQEGAKPQEPLRIEYTQAQILKAMIIAQYELEKKINGR